MAALVTGLTAGAARGAGWPTNAYPPWQHVRQSRTWADCTYSAATERAAALGISGPAAPAWWSGLFRDSRPDLVKYKAWYRTNAVSFLAVIADPEAHLEAGWPISYTNLNPSGPAAYWPRVTLTGLLANASLPTNYFDYTPLRDLSGLGMFTNDTDYAATGRAYGHTNARTAAGGTVPTNRTAWRTTDYGWAGITSLAARLTATEIVVTPTTYATNSSYSNAVFYGGSGSPAGDWASAYADAEANAINLAGERHPYYYAATFGLWATNGDHTATFHQQRLQNYWLSNSVFLCGIARSVDCYVFIGPWDFIAGSAAANHTTNFYCADFGITNAQWIALTNTASVTNARVMLPAITTTLPVTWCTNPATLSVTGEAASVVNTYFSSRDPIEDVYSLGVIVEYGRPIAREDCAVKATWAFEYK